MADDRSRRRQIEKAKERELSFDVRFTFLPVRFKLNILFSLNYDFALKMKRKYCRVDRRYGFLEDTEMI